MVLYIYDNEKILLVPPKMKKSIFLFVLLVVVIFNYASPSDSIVKKKWYKHPVITIGALPSVFIGYGCATFGENKLFCSSYSVRAWRNNNYSSFRTHADDFLWATPTVIPMSMKAAGLKTKSSLKHQLFKYALSITLANLIIQPLKYSTKILRPDGSTYNSFPSGHTTASFTGAEFMYQETKQINPWLALIGYGVATSVGTMRILNNRHWFTDVMVGAGIGMLSTKLVYFVWEKIERKRVRKSVKSVGP
jgi:membrane-associated phospholipid phosphatase